MAQGKTLFEQNCSVCHGPAGDGTTQGPPLVHIIYEPSHHADAAFVLAARNGVRAHHWRFGDMAPLPGVTDEMVLEIVGYIRWLQREVGSNRSRFKPRTRASRPEFKLQGQQTERHCRTECRLPLAVPHVASSGEFYRRRV